MSLTTTVSRRVTRFAEAVNEVVGHPVTFVLAFLQTVLWTVAVFVWPTFDTHGFWFLYLATAVSYVTQFTLTLVGLTAKREAVRASADSRMALEAQHATMQAVLAMLEGVRHTMEEQDELLDEVHDAVVEAHA